MPPTRYGKQKLQYRGKCSNSRIRRKARKTPIHHGKLKQPYPGALLGVSSSTSAAHLILTTSRRFITRGHPTRSRERILPLIASDNDRRDAS